MTPTGLLEQAVQRFADVFADDYSLLKGIAHEKKVIQKPVTVAPSVEDAYELRVLTGTDAEIAGLLAASVINVLCPDRRQAAKVARQLRQHGAIWLSPAGGLAQPQSDRREAITDVVAYTMEANPGVTMDGSAHTGGCANVMRSFSNPWEYYQYILGGNQGEVEFDCPTECSSMSSIAREIPDSLSMRGVDPSRIRVRLAHVGPDNNFVSLEG